MKSIILKLIIVGLISFEGVSDYISGIDSINRFDYRNSISTNINSIPQDGSRRYISVTTKRWHGEATATSGTTYYIKNNSSKTIVVSYRVKPAMEDWSPTRKVVVDAKSKKSIGSNSMALEWRVEILATSYQ